MNGLKKLVSAIDPRTMARNQAKLASLADSTRDLRKEMRDLQEMLSKLAAQATAVQLRTDQLVTLHVEDTKNRTRMDRLGKVLDHDSISAHVRKAVDRSELLDTPFPHLVISDLLPAKLYEAMVNAIPPRIFFEDRPVNKQQVTVPPDFAPAYSVAVWQFLTEVTVRQVLGPALAEKFQRPLDDHIRKLCPSLTSIQEAGITLGVSEGRILLRRPGYVIPPHRDPQWGLLTTIVYLARPDDREDYGTQLYRLDADREAPTSSPFYVNPKSCELVKTVPFRKNTALVFLNSSGAHGASIPADAPPDTERYIYQFRVGVDKAARGILLSRMDDETRSRWESADRGY